MRKNIPSLINIVIATLVSPLLSATSWAEQEQELSGVDSFIPSAPNNDCSTCLTSSTGTVTLTFTFEVKNGIQQEQKDATVTGNIPPAGATVQSYYLSSWDMDGAYVSKLSMTHGGVTYPIYNLDLVTGQETYPSERFPWTAIFGDSLVSNSWRIDPTVQAWASPLNYTLTIVFAVNWLAPEPPKPAPCGFTSEPRVSIYAGLPSDERQPGVNEAWGPVIEAGISQAAHLGGTFSKDENHNYHFSSRRSNPPLAQAFGPYLGEGITYSVTIQLLCDDGGQAFRALSFTAPPFSPVRLGCFVDSPTRALPVFLGRLLKRDSPGPINNHRACIGEAAKRGYAYAALQNGGECFAGNSLGHTRAYDVDCSMPCPFEPEYSCGGPWRSSVYSTGIKALSASPSPLPDPKTLYQGCYEDSAARTLPIQLVSSGATLESCIDTALANGYSYAGVQNGGVCYAGDVLPPNPAPESDCAMPCEANSGENCGGIWRSSVYATPSFGLASASAAGDSIQLSWTDSAADQVRFVVERRVGSSGAFLPVATLGPTTRFYDDPSTSLLTPYTYRIRADSASGGVSAHSMQASAISGNSVACLSAILMP